MAWNEIPAVVAPPRAEDGPLEDVARPCADTTAHAEGREEGAVQVPKDEAKSGPWMTGSTRKHPIPAQGPRELSSPRAPLGGASAPQECIDVRTLGRFKVRSTEDRAKGSRIDPWNLEMLCQKGTIYPHGGTRLQAHTARCRTRTLPKALPCVKVHQDGDFETTVVFDIRDFARVAEIMRPRKRRPAPAWLPRGPGSRRP